MRSAHFLRPRLSCGNDFSARLRNLRPGEAVVGETLADDALERERETHGVSSFAVIEAERLFIEVAEQMERFHAHVGALERTLQETPEVLASVGVNLPVNVFLGMVDDAVDEVASKPFVGGQRMV